MKTKVARILKSNKGETIMESIISLLMFAVLIIGVTEMVTAALRITGNSIENAEAAQKNVNGMILEDVSLMDDPVSVKRESGSIRFESLSAGIDVTHDVDVIIDGNNIASFIPQG